MRFPPTFHGVVSGLNGYFNKGTFEKKVVVKYTFKIESTVNGIGHLFNGRFRHGKVWGNSDRLSSKRNLLEMRFLELALGSESSI